MNYRFKDRLEFLYMPTLFGWVMFSVVGIILFPMLAFKWGLEWWIVLGMIFSFIGCCFPAYLDWRDRGKFDLKQNVRQEKNI